MGSIIFPLRWAIKFAPFVSCSQTWPSALAAVPLVRKRYRKKGLNSAFLALQRSRSCLKEKRRSPLSPFCSFLSPLHHQGAASVPRDVHNSPLYISRLKDLPSSLSWLDEMLLTINALKSALENEMVSPFNSLQDQLWEGLFCPFSESKV